MSDPRDDRDPGDPRDTHAELAELDQPAAPSPALQRLVDGVLAREVRATARLMRLVDDAPRQARPALAALYPRTGTARVVGVTGNPGSGKSTLVSKLIGAYRADGLRVGVVAVDPSSPFSGGAILGDRVRMMEHASDPGVFIRSVASRGALGGLSRSTDDLVNILDAMGSEVVIVETVGVGQAEVDIVELAQTTLVVMTPGLGDDVQAIKAGLMEIADIFVVNKADKPGVKSLVRQLRGLWDLGTTRGPDEWEPPVVTTVATEGLGVDELVDEIERHHDYSVGHPIGRARERKRVEHLLMRLVESDLREAVLRRQLDAPRRRAWVEALLARRVDPYSVAGQVVRAMLREGEEP